MISGWLCVFYMAAGVDVARWLHADCGLTIMQRVAVVIWWPLVLALTLLLRDDGNGD